MNAIRPFLGFPALFQHPATLPAFLKAWANREPDQGPLLQPACCTCSLESGLAAGAGSRVLPHGEQLVSKEEEL